ncbi:hypothetical protein K250101E9_59360 [Enterocloster aldenensis]
MELLKGRQADMRQGIPLGSEPAPAPAGARAPGAGYAVNLLLFIIE